MQPKSVIVVLMLSMILLPGGCARPPRGRPQSDRPFAARTVVVACPDENSRQIVEEYARAWESRTGARVHARLSLPGETAADVLVLAAQDLPKHAAANELRPLPATLTTERGAFGWQELLEYYRYYLLNWGDTAFAVPLQGEALLCFYRKDKLANRTHQSAYASRYGRPLRPPQTWEEFADIADYFLTASNQPSLPPMPKDDRELERLFYAVSAPYARRGIRQDVPTPGDVTDNDRFSFHFDSMPGEAEGRPRIASPGFVHGLTLLQRMQRCAPPGAPAAEPWKAFLAEDKVLCVADCRILRELQAKNSPVRDKVGVTVMPGSNFYFDYRTGERRTLAGNRVSYEGAKTYVLAVPQSAANADAAFDLLADLAGPATSMQIVLEPRWGAGATRLAQLERERWDAFQLPPADTRALGEALRQTHLHQVSNAALCMRHPWQGDFSASLVSELRGALAEYQQGEKRAAKALDGVAASWKTRIDKNPKEHVDYCRAALRR